MNGGKRNSEGDDGESNQILLLLTQKTERGSMGPSDTAKKPRPPRWAVLAFLVDLRGVEPLSENLLIQLSPGAEYLLIFLPRAPVLRLACQATVLCVIGSTVNRRCTCTTHLTLSLGSWSYREERVTRRSQHCHC